MNSMGNGIGFESDTPMMSGTWYNTTTGDRFTVRDSYFEDSELKVLTTDGRVLNYNILQHYIKSDVPLKKEEPIESAPVGQPMFFEEAPIENSVLTQPFKQEVLNNNVAQFNNIDVVEQQINTNDAIIEKALSKVKTKPSFDILVKWNNLPLREFSMLNDVMDIPMKEIVDYCVKKYVSDDYKEYINKKLSDFINKQLNTETTDKVVKKTKK